MGALLEGRRADVAARLAELRQKLDKANELTAGHACVYLTGSFGRAEASGHSDLDLFIVGGETRTIKTSREGGETICAKCSKPIDVASEYCANCGACVSKRALTNLAAIRVMANLIEATDTMRFPPFSGDGEFLSHHTVRELVDGLGEPEDDANNTFTVRLLLLLESRPLLQEEVYWKVLEAVIDAYWRDYEGREDRFIPAFLANDILRLWRTFCVNYEARTEKDPPVKRAKRKLKNYKLKHSRLLTCYSGLLYLLAVFKDKNTVAPPDILDLVRRTPTGRLEWLAEQKRFESSVGVISGLLASYEQFLGQTDRPETELIEQFMDKATADRYMDEARQFGDRMYDLLHSIGQGSSFYRLLVV